jgi:hypothetical protein
MLVVCCAILLSAKVGNGRTGRTQLCSLVTLHGNALANKASAILSSFDVLESNLVIL